jgi:glycosyltransferase involved in cell wall biosynthesis
LNIKILFIGFAISSDILNKVAVRDRNPQFAAHKLQWNIINGIEEYTGENIKIISAVPVSNFPDYPKIIFKWENWSHRVNSKDICIPFINIIIMKHITRFISALYCILSVFNKDEMKNRKKIILIYALHSPFLLAASVAKRLFGGKIAVVVPDMPEYMDLWGKRSLLRRYAKNIDGRLMKMLIMKMDGMILLTRYMAEDLLGGKIPSMVMEGAVSLDKIREAEIMKSTMAVNNREEKIIMYGGALTGIELLLDAFSRITGPEYRLWLCGRGEMEPVIRRATLSDPRIIYWGVVPDDEFLSKQLQSTVLVNVRSSRTPYIQYSFPSKLLEYMSVGRPVITTVLPGIPEEYHDYLYLLSDESPEALAGLLTDVCTKSRESLIAFGKRAQEFVRENKNNVRQGERIYRFLSSL